MVTKPSAPREMIEKYIIYRTHIVNVVRLNIIIVFIITVFILLDYAK